MQDITKFFWDVLESDIQDDHQEKQFAKALELLELQDNNLANQQVKDDLELQSLFGFNSTNHLHVIEEFSSTEAESQKQDDSSEEEVVRQTFRMNKTENDDYYEENPWGASTSRQRPVRKGNFYPPTAEFKTNQNKFGSNVLNIDCESKTERRTLIEIWEKEISLIIQTDLDAYDDPETVLMLVDHKTSGRVNRFIKDVKWNFDGNSPIEAFNHLVSSIYTIFLGIDYITAREQEKDKVKQKAKIALSKMQLCDICLIDKFFCDYEEHMINTGNQEEYHVYVEEYIRKIPLVGEKAMTKFLQERNALTCHSLAFAHRIVQEEIAKYCDFSRTQKKLKAFGKKYCSKISEETYTYGCSPNYNKSYKKKKKKYSKKNTSNYRFKKKRKPFKPGNYVRKKSVSTNKQKFCPKDKKNCRCWLCNEEGHYSNECPNKKKYPEKVKVLQEIYYIGYEPVEDKYDEKEEVFIIQEIDPGPTSSEESSEDESSSDDD